MRKISVLSDHIRDEIEDAEEYIREALDCQDVDSEVADLYAKLAEEELQHMSYLHKQVVRVIEQYRREHGDPPADMLARYEVLHEVHASDAAKVRLMIQTYKEG